MPIPERKQSENRGEFISRCMSDLVMNKEYPEQGQRSAVCISKANLSMGYVESVDYHLFASKDMFDTEEEARKRGEELGLDGTHKHGDKFMPGPSHEEYLQKVEGSFKYKDPKTGEIFIYQYKGIYKKDGRTLIPVQD